MQYDLSRHRYFTSWKDPASGVESFILDKRVAPVQKHLYYTTPSISADGKWLWFSAAFPPSRQFHLAVCCLDPDEPMIKLFPQMTLSGNPRVLPDGRTALVPVAEAIWRFDVDENIQQVLRLGHDLLAGKYLFNLITTTTISADGKYIVLDCHIGNRTLIALGEIETGQVKPLHWIPRKYHHAMFSPVDPELIMLAQAPGTDYISGDKFSFDIRAWLMDTKGQRFEPVLGDKWFGHNSKVCHEWWADDGTICWCDYDDGVFEIDLENRRAERVWAHPACHAHANADRTLLVCDDHPYTRRKEKPLGVYFYDRAAEKEIAIVTRMDYPSVTELVEPQDWRKYHLDPHPQFSPDGRNIVYCTQVRDRVDLAIAPVEAIRSAI
ncbi:MAG: hypothetical protein ACLFUJ_12555 [Phycisphaerae bacterium]